MLNFDSVRNLLKAQALARRISLCVDKAIGNFDCNEGRLVGLGSTLPFAFLCKEGFDFLQIFNAVVPKKELEVDQDYGLRYVTEFEREDLRWCFDYICVVDGFCECNNCNQWDKGREEEEGEEEECQRAVAHSVVCNFRPRLECMSTPDNDFWKVIAFSVKRKNTIAGVFVYVEFIM